MWSPPSLEEVRAARALVSFRDFVREAWQHADPAPLVWSWHIDAIAEHLQAVTEGQIRQLVINIPPGHAKSMLVSVLWPAWVWTRNPSWQLICASNAQDLVTRDAVKSRDLMRHEWYVKYFRSPDSPFAGVKPWEFSADQDAKLYFKNDRLGHRQGVSVGNGTGKRGDCLVIDDPLLADEAHSEVARENVKRWHDETMSSRFNDMKSAQKVLIMQRLHEDDLAGHVLRQGGWEHLSLPSEFVPKKRTITRSITGQQLWTDPRKDEGELLFPEKFPADVLAGAKRTMGSFGYSGQHQQDPVPADGGYLKRHWFNRRWVLPGEKHVDGLECRTLPGQFDLYSIFCDAAFKSTSDSDKIAIGVFGSKGPDVYLLQLAWERMTFSETVARLLDLRSKWSRVSGVYIEDKANGPAIIDVLKSKIPGLLEVQPDGGKEARIAAVGPLIEAGNFWLPLQAKWVDDFISEACAFPKAPHDDAIDMAAYAIRKLCNGAPLAMFDALTRM